MKKSKIFLYLTIGAITISCSKENNLTNAPSKTNETKIQSIDHLKQRDGMLVFKSHDDFHNAIKEFNKMDASKRIVWGENNQFQTQQIIMDNISRSEGDFDNQYFKGLDEDLTKSELEALGKPIEFSDVYKKYLAKGFISQTEEKDGFSYELAVNNQPSRMVCNEAGFVILNDSLYLFEKNRLRIKRYTGTNDLDLLKSNSISDEIIQVDYTSVSRSYHNFYIDNIFSPQGTFSNPTWYYDSPKHRFRHFVRFLSSELSQTQMSVVYYTDTHSHKKRWWKWDYRNDWRPLQTINGTWSYSWDYWYNGTTLTYTNIFQPGYNPATHSYNYASFGGSNHSSSYLTPNGTVTSNYPIADPMRIHGMHIKGVWIGTTGNYTTNYYH